MTVRFDEAFHADLFVPLLAQEGATGDGAVGVPDGASLPPRGAEGAPAAGARSGNPFGDLMPIVIGFAVLLFFISVLGPRREKKKREALMSSLKKHDRVQTIGGVVGAIVELKPDYVVLKVDESSNTRITFSRTAIQQVLGTSSSEETGKDR